MTITYFPFDAGAGSNVTESQWAQMARLWRPDGVISGFANLLETTGDSSGMQVKVKTGTAWIEGHYVENDALLTLAIDASHATLHRYDLIVARIDWVNNLGQIAVLKGTPGAAPVVPAVTQTFGTTWEIPLALVYIAASVITITAGGVTDKRSYSYAARANSLAKQGCNLTHVGVGTIGVGAGVLAIGAASYERTSAFNITFANIDTGAEAAGTNYYVYAIPGATAGQFDAVISASATSPTGYANYRLIGWFHNNPASAIMLYSVASARADADVDYPEKGPKPGMVQYPGASWMIDIYIASNSGGTGKAIHAGNAAASAYDVHPWVNTTYFAQYKACMNAGKRLCSNEEWSMAAFGSPPGADNNNYCWTKATNTEIRHTGVPGSVGPCVSTLGCYDMTGNVWERVATWSMVTDVYTDQNGWAWTNEASTWTGEAEGGEAYTAFGANAGADAHQGPRALFRGGDWGNSVSAGGWSVHGDNSPRVVNTGIGFRCCS